MSAGFKPSPKLPLDALDRAMQGVLPPEGDPINDPLWMEVGAINERNRIRRELTQSGSGLLGSGFCCGSGSGVVTDDDGQQYTHSEFVERQNRVAYELLRYGYDIRTIAVRCHLTPAEVAAIQTKFNL